MTNKSYLFAFSVLTAVLWSLEGAGFWTVTQTVFFTLLLYLHKVTLKMAFIFVFVIVCVFLWCEITASPVSSLNGNSEVLEGKVVTDPVLIRDQYRFQLKTISGERVMVYVETPVPGLHHGSACAMKGTYKKPGPVYHTYGFDYALYLERQGVFWIFYTDTSDQIVCEARTSVKQSLLHYRNKGIEGIRELGVKKGDPHTAAVMQALVFGERGDLPEDHRAAYQVIGVSHLLAVSGLHVGLVVLMILFLLKRSGFTKETATNTVFILLPVYIIIAGGAPSVVRASLMVMFAIAALKMSGKVKPSDSIVGVFIVLLLFDPSYIYHLGFQLSFLTSFVLITSGKILEQGETGISILFRVTLLAQVVSLPIILNQFYEFSLLSLPFNLLFIPFISIFVLPVSIAAVLFLPVFPLLSELLFNVISNPLGWLHNLLFFLNDLTLFRLHTGKISSEFMAVLMAVTVLLFRAWERRALSQLILLTLCFCGLIGFKMLAPYYTKYGTVTMLDVGQGDAILIELPRREKVYLIDTGGVVTWGDEKEFQGPGQRVILPHLAAKGITQIDKLILTHGHTDHIGETCVLSHNIKINRVLYPSGEMLSDLEKEVQACLHYKGIPIVEAKEGLWWEAGENRFRVISPSGSEASENNRSIVLLARMGKADWLFTGDIEEEAESRIVRDYPGLKADVLKVPHHGSSSSSTSEFVELVNPAIGIIPVGRNNRFQHPGSEVVERFREMGTDIYRTDIHGDVTIRFHQSGGGVKVITVVTE
ncbi:DNA internalization-related competence protein ComEC/Rec2 [Bacillus sp. H-16]|uniref:DNA internalization-related competence protein ComEC/Rec2 n=1 Tax=Alteribacter salitolerans TaxID=2912333 RepID=UPI001963E061|nr:DNA internalization-related competence protein ComEC/Rec2 [Alteribacter salitolerans]MBM7097132.1 DNA internalization-related competence protein ComEC/Rec2 [Alteribacter salitolerans]